MGAQSRELGRGVVDSVDVLTQPRLPTCSRQYGTAAQLLADLGHRSVRLRANHAAPLLDPTMPAPCLQDEWYVASDGRRFWGQHGAAGIMAVTRAPLRVLMVRRAGWVHGGAGQWSIPGGALQVGETAAEAAEREFVEELGFLPRGWQLIAEHIDHVVPGEWAYTTFVADVGEAPDFAATMSDENDAHAWVAIDELHRLELFAPFARVLPCLTGRLTDQPVGGTRSRVHYRAAVNG